MPTTGSFNNPMAGVASAAVVAHVEQDTQGTTFQPEPAVLHGQGEVIPAPESPHTPPPVFEHVASVQLVVPAPALVSALALSVAPALNVDLNVDLNLNPAQPTLMGSFHGIGGIQFAGEVPVADDNPVQQPLLRSLWGFEDIQFGNEGEDEDY